MAQTVIEKIVQSHAVGLKSGRTVQAGDYVTLVPDHVMTQEKHNILPDLSLRPTDSIVLISETTNKSIVLD